MNWLLHCVYLLCIVVAACGGVLGGIVIDQKFITRETEVRTVVKQIEIAVPDCSAQAMKICWKKKTG